MVVAISYLCVQYYCHCYHHSTSCAVPSNVHKQSVKCNLRLKFFIIKDAKYALKTSMKLIKKLHHCIF